MTTLSRSTPQHASLGVLRSPDIPSVLVETGFLSNAEEEQKLNSPAYRRRIAYMIYEGLVAYRNGNLKSVVTVEQENADKDANKLSVKDSLIRHKVKNGESLGSLANKYDVKTADIIALNKLKRKELWIGETIKIPDNGKNQKAVEAKTVEPKKAENKKAENKKAENKSAKSDKKTDPKKSEIPLYHIVQKDQTIYAISREYNIPVNQILKLNPKLKDGKVLTGQKIKLREK